MKKLVLAFLLTYSFNAFNQCNYSFTLGDSFGDGWNTGEMIVVQNSDTVAHFYGPTDGTAENIVVPLTSGVPADLIWNVPGFYPEEMTIDVYDADGVLIFSIPSNSNALAGDTIYSWTPSCPPCAGLPSPGNTISSLGNSICPNSNFVLSLQNQTTGSGVTYQWYSSTDGVTYAPITGANTSSYSSTMVSAVYYYCAVDCSGSTTNSTPVSLTVAPFNQCYCTPIYLSGTQAGDLISNVQIEGTTLSNNTGFVSGGPSYTFFTGQPNYTATLIPSNSYNLNISTGEWGSQGYAAWIDYNDDGVFDLTERIGYTNGTIGTNFTQGQVNDSSTFVISLACNPPAGNHRLRIRGAYFTDGDLIDPCTSYGYGETEDYEVTIAAAPACPSAGVMTGYTATETTATVTWLLGCSSSNIFNLEYGPAGFTPGTGTILSNQTAVITNGEASYTFTNLIGTTTYDFYYQAICGTNTSSWSATNQFTTACSVVTALGWCEGFDDASATEQCWTILNVNNDFTAWDMNTTFNQLNGNNCASISTDFNAGNNDDWLISPQLILNGTEILNFNYRVISEFEPNDLKVKISTTGNNPADFTQTLLSLDSIANTIYQDTSVNLSAFTGNVYIAFHIPQGGLDGWVLYLDQICMTECVPANITSDSIQICQTADSLDLTTVLNIGQSQGNWSLVTNPSALNGSILYLDSLITGVYAVNYLVNDACQSTAAEATVFMYEPSNAGIDSAAILCKGQPFNLFDALTGNFQTSGTWYDPNNQVLTGSYIITGNFPGQFNYDYIVTNGVCPSDSSNALLIVNDCIYVGLDEMNASLLSVYPNPTDGTLQVQINEQSSNYKLQIHDAQGRMVYQHPEMVSSSLTFSIDLNHVLPGMYYLNLFSENNGQIITIVKK
jgi:hypothetical protein